MAKIQQYAQETTIHGFQEFLRYKSSPFRVTWALVLAALLVALVVGMSSAIGRYLEAPVATKVGYVAEQTTSFPDFALCTNDWMNMTKFELDFPTLEDKVAFTGPMCPSVRRPSFLLNYVDMLGRIDAPLDEARLEAGINRFESLVNDHGSLGNLIRYYAMDYRAIGGEAVCGSCVESVVPTSVIVKDVGPCWLFKPGLVPAPTDRMTSFPYVDLKFQFPKESPMNEHSTFYLYLGELARDATAPSSSTLVGKKSNDVDFFLEKKTTVRNCNSSELNLDGLCEVACFELAYKRCGIDCNFWTGDLEPANKTAGYCSFVAIGKKERNRQWVACLRTLGEECKKCPRRCSHLTAHATVFSRQLPPWMKDDMYLRIRALNLFSTLHYEEFYAYTLGDLLSDFGGLLGLFLGASFVSVIHMIYFCIILPCLRRREVEDSEDSDM